MDDILAYWGLSGESVTHVSTSTQKVSWSVGDKYMLQQNLAFSAEKVAGNIRLANLLIANQIPAVTYIQTLDGAWTTPDGVYFLTKKIKGAHIDFYESPHVLCELGRGLARLHRVLAKIEPEITCEDYDFLAKWKNYTKPGLVGVSDEMIAAVESKIFSYEKFPRCPIHRDVHAGNILFDDGKISGWLDFDLNRKDARVFDLAYLLAGLLVGNIDDPCRVDIWKAMYQNVLSGYHAISPLTPEEIDALPSLMMAIELLFVTYWNQQGNADGRDKAMRLAEWLATQTELGNHRLPNSIVGEI